MVESGKMVVICPGQGAQSVGMGRAWFESSSAAAEVFRQADAFLGSRLGAALSEICFNGPAERLNQTDVSQPAIYVCSIACWHGIGQLPTMAAAAGLSLGEYTALHLAGVFDFLEGLELVVKRGRLMQDAAVASRGGMVALIGAEEEQALEVCKKAAEAEVLVPANFNAPGQIVLSGHAGACQRAATVAGELGLRATPLTVAGAFHSPLMQPAAEGMTKALAGVKLRPGNVPVWSNVTAKPHPEGDSELLKRRLVEQIVSPVRWSQSCQGLIGAGLLEYHELAPGTVLKGLMRRIDRNAKVTNHDQPASEPTRAA